MSEKTDAMTKSAGMGAIPGKNGTAFRVWAPNAEKVYVTGSFNHRSKTSAPLAKAVNGCWSGEVPEAKSGDEYRCLVHGVGGCFSRIEPYARKVTKLVCNGVIYDPSAFDWAGDDFHMATGNELVIYEMHIGTFNAKETGRPGTLESAMEKFPTFVLWASTPSK